MVTPSETFGTSGSDTPTAQQPRDWIEVATVVLLGLATIAIAWAAYQSSLWGGVQDKDSTSSVLQLNRANDSAQFGDSILAFDKQLFVEMVLIAPIIETDEDFEFFVGPDGAGGFLLQNMSVPGRIATEDWFVNDFALPWDDQEFLNAAYYSEAIEFTRLSDKLFVDASDANKNSDDYVLSSTILAAVLFLAGISTVLRARSLQWSLIIGSAVLFLGSVIFMLTLPNAIGA